jgi:flagellar biosynthesis/type III secretory pathway M-ring protein FliF/YscJ
MDEFWSNALWSVTPTILVGLIFWFVMRSVIHADRNERKAYAQIEAAERARMGLPDPDETGPTS